MWAPRAGHEKCVQCGTTEIMHKSKGRCLHCFQKWQREQPKRKEKLKQWKREYFERNRNKPEFIERRKHSQVKDDRKRRIERRLATGKIHKVKIKGVQYTCECCGEKIQTPYTSAYLKDNMLEFREYQKKVMELHQQV